MGHVRGYVADVSIFLGIVKYVYPRATYIALKVYTRAIQFRRAIRMRV